MFNLSSPSHVVNRLAPLYMLMVVVWAGGCSRRHLPMSPIGVDRTTGSASSKPVVRKTRYWDGSVGLVHPGGSRVIAAWPMQLSRKDRPEAAVATTKRCERIAHGSPYVGSQQGAPSTIRFNALEHAALREFDRLEVERTDPCVTTLGTKWRVPSVAEFTAYAEYLARPGSWFLRNERGELEMVDYAPPILLRMAEAVEVPARIRISLANTAHVFCLNAAAPTAIAPEPSRNEIERCVRLFYAPEHSDSAAVNLPELGRPQLLAVRHACREAGPNSEWMNILRSTEAKVNQLAEALVDPQHLERPLDQQTEDFIDTLYWTMNTCLERPLHPSTQSTEVAQARLRELQTILLNAHERRDALQKRQVDTEEAKPVPLQDLESIQAPQSKRGRCNCAESDLACNLRCSARN